MVNPQITTALVLGVVCIICLFVAFERYQDNQSKVDAVNQFGGGLVSAFNGGEGIQATTPTATKYAVFFAGLSGVFAVVFLIAGTNRFHRERERRAS